MIQIEARDHQLNAIATRILLKGKITDIKKIHGHTTMFIDYENRKIEIVQNRIDGTLVTIWIEDRTLNQMFTRNALAN